MKEPYREKRWHELRKRILARDKYFDKVESRYGRYKSADLVHHIFPVKMFPEYKYCEWNLISVSWETHNKLHDRNSDDLSDLGKELLIRTAQKNNIPVPSWVYEEKKKFRKKYDRVW